MEELRKSLNESLFHRVSSPMYGTFIMSWIITNRKIFYATFFLDGDILMELGKGSKLDYILSFYPGGISNLLDVLCGFWSVCKLLLIPAGAVFIYIWYFSKLDKKVYDKYQDNEFDKWEKKNLILVKKNKIKGESLEKEKQVVELEQEVLSQKSENLKSQEITDLMEQNLILKEKVTELLMKNSDLSNVSFEEEYVELDKGSKLSIALSLLKKSIYEYKGRTKSLLREEDFTFNPDMLAFLDLKGLIIISLDNNTEKVSLTEKGKFFLDKRMNK